MGFGSISSKTVIGCLSVLFLAASIAMWIMGGYVIATYNHYDTLSSAYFTTVPATVLIFVGVIFLFGTISGVCSALRDNRCCKMIFFLFVFLIFVLLITTIILVSVYRGKLNDKVEDEAKKAMDQYENKTSIANQVNYLQEKFTCCGLTNYTSWEKTPFGHNHTQHVPLSCCRNATDCKEGDLTRMGHDVAKYIYTDGCVMKLQKFWDSNLYYVGGGALAFLIILLLGLVASCVVLWKRKDESYFNLGS